MGFRGPAGAVAATAELLAGTDLVVLRATSRAAATSIRYARARRAEWRPVVAVTGNHDVDEGEGMLAAAVATVGLAQPAGVVHGPLRVAGVQVMAPTAATRRWSAPRRRRGATAGVFVTHFPAISRAEMFAERDFKYPGTCSIARRCRASGRATAPTVVLAATSTRATARRGPGAPARRRRADRGAVRVRDRRRRREASGDARGAPLAARRWSGRRSFRPRRETWSFDGLVWSSSR